MEPSDSPFSQALSFVKRHLWMVFFFSFLINLLMLTAPLYMLQVYDRVLTSRSEYTLLFLTLIAIGALATLTALDVLRSRLLVRISSCFDQKLGAEVFSLAMRKGMGAQPLRDLSMLRTFFTGPTLVAFFDAPWAPIYILMVYILHPWLGHVALLGAVILFLLALLNETLTKQLLVDSSTKDHAANEFAESSARNTEAVVSMGILPGLRKRWALLHKESLGFQAVASDRGAVVSSLAKFIRFTLQISILCVGAFLAINEEVSSGAMIAASIIMGRGLAPVESSISGWRSAVLAQKAYYRLAELMLGNIAAETMPLPPPSGHIIFDNVYAAPPGCSVPTVSGVSFELEAGTTLGVTGPSAAGKSSIAKLMVGIWVPRSGVVRLDNAELSQWSMDELGPHIGYLPQDIELFNGTVAENIARFGEVDPAAVVDAAKLAGADVMIRELAEGYDTQIGSGGSRLSGGQRQRIGLARAFYRRPALILLDEPTSNLDSGGESAVRFAIDNLKSTGSTVVVIAHKPTVVGGVDKLMVVQKGQVTHYGLSQDILPQITRRVASQEAKAV